MGMTTELRILFITIFCLSVDCITITTKDRELGIRLDQYGIYMEGNQINFGLKVLGTQGSTNVKLRKSDDDSFQYKLIMSFYNNDWILVEFTDSNSTILLKQNFDIVNNCRLNCTLMFNIHSNITHLTVTKIEEENNQTISYRYNAINPQNIQSLGIRSRFIDAEWTFYPTDSTPESSSQPNDSTENMTTAGIPALVNTSDNSAVPTAYSDTTSSSDDTTSLSDNTMSTAFNPTHAPNTTPSLTEVTLFCLKVNETRNVTTEELQEMIAQLRSQLVVNKTNLSSFIRAKTSADDKRPSATVIGYVGTVVIISLIVTIVMLDLPHLCRFLKCKEPKRKWN